MAVDWDMLKSSANLRNSMNERNTLFFINISLILFSKGPTRMLLVERYIERHILRERTSSSHIFFWVPGDAKACTPLQACQRRTDWLCGPSSTLILCTLSKSYCVVLITWSPSSYTPVVPECPDVLSYPCFLIRA